MKRNVWLSRLLLIMALCLLAGTAWSEQVAAPAPAAASFPVPGKWQFLFAPGASVITFFLKGNVHDTLGYVKTIDGTASALVSADGRLAEPAVQFKFAAGIMDSKDERRDKRMKTKFLEIDLYPEISFKSTGAGPGLADVPAVTKATKEAPLAFDLQGSLTIHGVTKDIAIPVTVYPENGLLITEGKTVLLLKDYNIKNPSFLVFRTEDKVQIEFHIELKPALHTPAAQEAQKK